MFLKCKICPHRLENGTEKDCFMVNNLKMLIYVVIDDWNNFALTVPEQIDLFFLLHDLAKINLLNLLLSLCLVVIGF